jgi:hypothetical protein
VVDYLQKQIGDVGTLLLPHAHLYVPLQLRIPRRQSPGQQTEEGKLAANLLIIIAASSQRSSSAISKHIVQQLAFGRVLV